MIMMCLAAHHFAAISQTISGRQEFTVHFRNNSSLLLSDYKTNKATLERLDACLNDRNFNSYPDTIYIIGHASVVGDPDYNDKLAHERAASARSYIRWKYPHFQSFDIVTTAYTCTSSHRNIPHFRNAVITLVWKNDSAGSGSELHCSSAGHDTTAVAETGSDEEPCDAEYRGGVDCLPPTTEPGLQSDPAKNILPEALNESGTGIQFTADTNSLDITHKPAYFSLNPRFAIKTNLLYWCLLTPNIEFEYYVARRWSINIEYQGAWWSNKSEHKYFRLMAGSPEVRFWISRKESFKGHFAGVYLGVGSYEFMGRPSHGLQGEFFIAGGISYGYAFPVGKRLRMEVSIGLGYMITDYKEYHWDNGCYVYDRTKRQTYIGPTKAKVSLTYPLRWGVKKQAGER